jgi:hypothetical protein
VEQFEPSQLCSLNTSRNMQHLRAPFSICDEPSLPLSFSMNYHAGTRIAEQPTHLLVIAHSQGTVRLGCRSGPQHAALRRFSFGTRP